VTKARLAVILLQGRGATPEDLLELADEWNIPDIAYVAPAAAGHTWYPESFLAPIDRNEPWLTSALGTVERVLGEMLASRNSGDRRPGEFPARSIGACRLTDPLPCLTFVVQLLRDSRVHFVWI
jgi:hypothetical protein